ncbi:hypothetical protein IAU60_003471 [Kwoniella sp. DSM 27419]
MTEHHVDHASLAVVLSADYPLIDPPLILAILSDYPSTSLSSNLDAIRDQLGILEATLVPDPDHPSEPERHSPDHESWTESTSVTGSTGVDELSSRLDSLAIGSGRSDLSDEEHDELELLRSLFPAIPANDLQSTLSSSLSLQAAIDHLLSLELIRNVQAEGHWPGEESDTDNEKWENGKARQGRSKLSAKPVTATLPLKDSSRSTSKAGKSRQAAPAIHLLPRNGEPIPLASSPALSRTSTRDSTSSKKKKKEKTIIPLVDTLQRKPSPMPSRPSSRPISRSTSANGRDRSLSPSRNKPTDNAWHTVSSLASYLADILSHPQSYFLTYLHSPTYHSAYSAVKAALAALPAGSDRASVPSKQVLEDIYGLSLADDHRPGSKREAERDLEICVHAVGGDVATVMDLMDLLAEISEWPGDDDVFEPRPEFTLNKSARSSAISLHIEAQPTAVSMSRTSSAGSAISDVPPSPVLGNGHALPSVGSTLPGKMTRKPKKPTVATVPEVPLTGGAIREAKLREVPGSKPTATSATHPTAFDTFGMQSPVPSSPKPKRDGPQIHVQNWRTVSHARAKPREVGAGAKLRKMTVEECMAQAQLERVRRETAIRAAGRHFKYSATGMGGGGRAAKGAVAGHYATQAREAAERAKEWELKAARMVVESHLAADSGSSQAARAAPTGSHRLGNDIARKEVGGGTRTIDLHHLTVNEATVIVSEVADQWWAGEKEHRAEGWKARPDGKLIIVTGVGRHSVKGQGVLGPAVSNHLEKAGWKIDRGDSERGYLVVRGRA